MTTATRAGGKAPLRSFGLLRAMGVSVAVHALVALLLAWVPLVRDARADARAPDETAIEFTFLDTPDTDVDEPAGDLPPQPSLPVPTPDPVPGEPVPAEPPVEPAPETPDLPEAGEPANDLAPGPPATDPPPERVEPDEGEADRAAETLSDAQDASRRDGASEPRPRASDSRVDLDGALRDFGRQMANRPQRPSPPVPQSRRDPGNIFVPDLSQVPATGFGMGNLTFESTDFDWSDYGRQIYMAIWRAWHQRLYLTTNEFDKWAHSNRRWYLDHWTAVRFVIERSGQVTGIVTERESGCGPLDASAVDALDEVILPPLPAGFPRDREVVRARFATKGDVRTMKDILGHYKRLGLF